MYIYRRELQEKINGQAFSFKIQIIFKVKIKRYLSLNKKEVIVLQFYFHNFQYNTIQIIT